MFRNSESVGISSGASPGHRKRSKVGDLKCFSDMDTSHGRRRFNEDIGALTGFPGGYQQFVQPASELEMEYYPSDRQESEFTYLHKRLLHEADGEHPILNAYPHQFCRVAADGRELDSVLNSIQSQTNQ